MDFNGQQEWRLCRNCGVLAYADLPNQHCILGTFHNNFKHDFDLSGHNYKLLYQLQDTGPKKYTGQPGWWETIFWRWCRKCGGLFYPNDVGYCAAGGDHDPSGSWFYILSHQEFTGYLFDLTFCAHETGHSLGFLLEGMASTPNGDVSYGDPLDIMSENNAFQFPAPFFRAGPGMNAPNLFRAGWISVDRVRTLDVYGSYDITLAAVNYPNEAGYLMTRVLAFGLIFTVELRHPSAWDQGISQAQVFIHVMRQDEPYSIGNGLVQGQQFVYFHTNSGTYMGGYVAITVGSFKDEGKMVDLTITLKHDTEATLPGEGGSWSGGMFLNPEKNRNFSIPQGQDKVWIQSHMHRMQ
jgi:hypothetical protein